MSAGGRNWRLVRANTDAVPSSARAATSAGTWSHSGTNTLSAGGRSTAAVSATPPSPGSRISPGPNTSRITAWSASASAAAISVWKSRVRYTR